MPVNTPALGPGGGPNAPFGLGGSLTPGDVVSVGPLAFGPNFGASLDTLSASSVVAQVSALSAAVGAFVVQGSASSFTLVTWVQARPTDVILTGPILGAAVSSVSSGLVPWSHCTVAGQIEFRLSNVSTLVQNQSAQTWGFVRISMF